MTMFNEPGGALRHGLQRVGWDNWDLWMAMYAIGGNLDLGAIDRIVDGRHHPNGREYNLLSLTVNEHLADLGLEHPLPTWNELTDLD